MKFMQIVIGRKLLPKWELKKSPPQSDNVLKPFASIRQMMTRRLAVLFLFMPIAAAPQTKDRVVVVLYPADHVIVHKKDRTLELRHGDSVLQMYKIALGSEPIGPKMCQGDHRTPEGSYLIDSRNAASKFHRSLHIAYPNAEDRKRAEAAHCSPGGDIMIHGLPNGYGFIGAAHRLKDWTDGCIAVTDQEIEEIWKRVPNGTPVDIQP
jgi:murein L,D-transpeptidase YafK